MAHLQIAQLQGTIKATPNYDPESDAKKLRDGMKGLGTDESAIIQVLARRTAAERMKLATMYKTMYGKDLKKDLESELGGDLKMAVQCLLMPADELDARELARAMKGLGTDEAALIEILATRTNAQIEAIKKSYKTHFKANLEDDIRSDTSGDFQKLLVSFCAAGRKEDQKPDVAKAKADAATLYKAGEKRLGTDEAAFNAVLASQSYDQLRVVFEEYDKLAGKPIEKSIESEMSGDLEKGMLAIVKCARNRPAYFAEKIYKTMKGMGTDEKSCIRLIVTRCEYDMVQIKEEFQKMYKKSMVDYIKGDFSGDTEKILCALVM